MPTLAHGLHINNTKKNTTVVIIPVTSKTVNK